MLAIVPVDALCGNYRIMLFSRHVQKGLFRLRVTKIGEGGEFQLSSVQWQESRNEGDECQ
jgi:hypothetical protein